MTPDEAGSGHHTPFGPGDYLVAAADHLVNDARLDRAVTARIRDLLVADGTTGGTPAALLKPPDAVETAVLMVAAGAIFLAKEKAGEDVFFETVDAALRLMLRCPPHLRDTAA